MIKVFAFALLLLISVGLYADNDFSESEIKKDNTEKVESSIPSPKQDLVQTSSRILLFLSLLAGGGYCLVRFTKNAKFNALSWGMQKAQESRLKIKETKALGNRQFLIVVEHDQKSILLATGPNGVHFLCNLSSPSSLPSEKISQEA